MSPRRRGFDLETEIQCSEFALDLLDAQIAAEQRLRWRELAPQLEALGFDISDQPEPPMPHVLEQRSERLMRAYQRELDLRGWIRPSFWRQAATKRR